MSGASKDYNDSIKIILAGLTDIAAGLNRDMDLDYRVMSYGVAKQDISEIRPDEGADIDIPSNRDWNISFVASIPHTTDMENIVFDIQRNPLESSFAQHVLYEYNNSLASALGNIIEEKQQINDNAFCTTECHSFCKKWLHGWSVTGDVHSQCDNYSSINSLINTLSEKISDTEPLREQLQEVLLEYNEDSFDFGFEFTYDAHTGIVAIDAIWAHENDFVFSRERITAISYSDLSSPERFAEIFNPEFTRKFPYHSFGEFVPCEETSCTPNF